VCICIDHSLVCYHHLKVNKQLNDKERVAAALENNALLDVVHKCLEGSDPTAFTPTQLKEKMANQKKKIDYSTAF
jgi:hypothetical protein